MAELNVSLTLANLLVILLSAKLFGELACRLGQPAVLGELVGGVLLGLGLVGFFRPEDPALELMAQLGVILLLFETGLASDLRELLRAGPASLGVALTGMALPFALGWLLMRAAGQPPLACVLVGSAMTATSVGITARALSDLGRLGTREARIILGAAVIDDVLGLVLLAAVTGVARLGTVSWSEVARVCVMSTAFLGLSLWLGPKVSARLMGLVRRMKVRGVLIVSALCFAFSLALLAEAAGTALIVGAFTAGALLARTGTSEDIAGSLAPVADVFVPVFFVLSGARVDLTRFDPALPGAGFQAALAAGLVALAVLGKVACGWAARGPGLRRLAVGVGMVPRGEVGLIFAQLGLSARILTPPLYASLVAMVFFTTLAAPPLLKRAFGGRATGYPAPRDV